MAWVFFRGLLAGRSELAIGNLTSGQQLAVLQRSVKRPKLRMRDRVFWVWLSKIWLGWRSAIAIAGRPETEHQFAGRLRKGCILRRPCAEGVHTPVPRV